MKSVKIVIPFLFLGNPTKKNPTIVGQKSYGKKNFVDLMDWDPRPEKFRKTTQHELNNFVSSIQMMNETYNEKIPNYAASIKIAYEDYQVSDDEVSEKIPYDRKRNKVLKDKVSEFHRNLKNSLKSIVDSHGLSTEEAMHVSVTFEQAKSDEWHRYVHTY